MTEGKHVFISILAALVAYSAAAAAAAPLITHSADFLADVVTAQLSGEGAPPEAVDEAVKAVQPIAATMPYLIPFSVIINSALLGALFGMLYSHLIRRTGRRVLAAVAAGSAHAALVGAAVAVIYAEGLMGVFSRYVSPLALLTPAFAYLIALVAFSFRGPWERLAEEEPSRY